MSQLPQLQETCSRILLSCNLNSLTHGICVHSPIIKLGLHHDLYLTNNLLSLYAKCCGSQQAHRLFDEMPQRDVVSWTGLLSAHVRSGNHENVFELFGSMLVSGEKPNEFTFSSVLRSCSALAKFEYGSFTHSCIAKHGFGSNTVLNSALIQFYSKCDRVEEAYKLFEETRSGDTITWTTMISSLLGDSKWSQALRLYSRMIGAKIPPNEYTFVKLLSASSFIGLEFGMILHAQLILWGVTLNLILKTALVDMYSKCHKMEDAIKVFNLTCEYDVHLWTSIVSGFAQNSKVGEAINSFHEMEITGVKANNFTYASLLNAGTLASSLELGWQIHSRVIMVGMEKDVSVGNALVDIYMKCSPTIDDARNVFRDIDDPNVVSWTTLIAGLCEHGFLMESFQSLAEMRAREVQPNSYTLSSLLGLCSRTVSTYQAKQLHGYAVKLNADTEIAVGNALVDTYAGLGLLEDAWCMVTSMEHRDAITYTSLATRLNHMGNHRTALSMISCMVDDNVKMDEFSLASFLSAAAALNAKELGKQLHCHSVKSGLGRWKSVSTGLVDLYGSCSCVHDAQKAFQDTKEPDVVSWNSLISGLASNGYISSSLSAFEDMTLEGVKPDSHTLSLLLFACSRGGLPDMGLEYFNSFKDVHNREPQLDHYISLVDLLGRAGRIEEARDVIETMPMKPNAMVYKTLLGACRLHKNIPVGEEMARQGLQLNPYDLQFYTLLENLYVASGRSDLIRRVASR